MGQSVVGWGVEMKNQGLFSGMKDDNLKAHKEGGYVFKTSGIQQSHNGICFALYSVTSTCIYV